MITSSASPHSNTQNANIYQPAKNSAGKVGGDVSNTGTTIADVAKPAATAVQNDVYGGNSKVGTTINTKA